MIFRDRFWGVIRSGGSVSVLVALVLAVPISTPTSADILSKADARIAKAAFKAIEAKRPKRALNLAARLSNPVAAKVIAWHVYKNPAFKRPFTEVLSFIAREPDWPQQKKLQLSAEESLPRGVDPANVVKLFKKRPPVSTTGKVKYIRALMDTGRKKQAIPLIRDTWINGNFGKHQERGFYRRYRRHLSRADHRARLDRLLWLGRYWPVRRMLWKVKKGYRALAVARLLLRHRRGNVDKSIAQVPAHLKKDLGLVYERLRWRRRKGKIDGALELLKGLPPTLPHAERWWKEFAYLARKELQKGHVSEAYRITKNHGAAKGAAFADAEWMSGWISLRFLKDKNVARRHFTNLYKKVKYPVSRARGAYWVGRAYDALKNKSNAEAWYKTASGFPTTYYGQLAIARLSSVQGLELPPQPKISKKILANFKKHDLTRAIRILDEIGERKRLKPFVRRLAALDPAPEWQVLTGNLSRQLGRLDQTISIAKKARQKGILLPDIGYPIIRLPKTSINRQGHLAEYPLILAMIRQESAFYVKAKSHAGARGLLQLMPATAKKVAQQIGISYSKGRLTTDPAYNLKLGRHYLEGLLGDFKGSYIMAIAGYNAGPSRVKRWVRKFGDPRDSSVNAIDWVEMIPFDETRNYVQRVLENLQVYRSRLSANQVAQTLEGDLNR
ncbi:MAG: lytic transglycosylase domain-containing protein [Rhodospirillaceae bacterium]|nr:lytic transglycosylase domain-containing protein [Rhodospirillaceae bacterium]